MPSADSLESLDLIGPDHYARHGYPHAAWARLRREAPLYRHDRGDVQPFWAVTKHADIVWLSKQPRRFRNAPRLAVFPDIPPPEGEAEVRHLLNMDPPQHGAMRRIVSKRFTPRAVRAMQPEIERIAAELIDGLGEGGTDDFVTKVSAILPLAVIADMLGVPRDDWKRMFDWTNSIIGATDPEYQRAGETPVETAQRARTSLFEYFLNMASERREKPRGDLVSLVANAALGGEPLPPRELLSYFFLIVVAGNETTRNATSGGLLALIENPGELEKLRRDPSLVPSAVEEIVRWTTPVIQFVRTATQDVELRGQKVRAGDNLCLFYPSANRDEEVFDDSFAFRVDRRPNPHLAFGIGEHVCLGANVARLELQAIFRRLVERLAHVELAGPVERLRSSFVGGIKRMPIRYELNPPPS